MIRKKIIIHLVYAKKSIDRHLEYPFSLSLTLIFHGHSLMDIKT